MPDFKLSKVDPAKLPLAWDAVKEGLENIRRKSPNATFRDEQVFAAIVNGVAELFCASIDGEYGGFVILAESPEAFTLERRLLIWCAYTAKVLNGRGRLVMHPRWREIRELTEAEIDKLALERGIRRQYLVSARPWDRNHLRGDWRFVESTWEKRL